MKNKIKRVDMMESYRRPYPKKDYYELYIKIWVTYENNIQKYYETEYERLIYDIPMTVIKAIKKQYNELPF